MTVKELIRYLSEQDQDLEILVDGYEHGKTTGVYTRRITFLRDVNDSPFCGEHEEPRYVYDEVERYEKSDGILLSRDEF